MKLLYITNGVSGGNGLERVLSIKASYFAETYDYEVHIITLNEENTLPFFKFSPKIIFHNIKTHKGVRYLFSYINGINQLIIKIQPDIISVCDDGLKGLYVPLWIKKGKAKIIYERHASLLFNGSQLQKALIQLGAHLYDQVIVLTKSSLNEWTSDNLRVIPNPLSFSANQRAELSNHSIICVGSIVYNKGYDLLIDAWKKIAHKYPTWNVHIYGKGNASCYIKQAQDANIESQITFHGASSDIETIYQHASILVLPSRTEGFGMVLIEAMAHGVPCIAFDCPCGPRDIIVHQENGFLVKPQDTEEMAEYISTLIEDHKLRKDFGKHASLHVQKYSIEEIGLLWKKLFEELYHPCQH